MSAAADDEAIGADASSRGSSVTSTSFVSTSSSSLEPGASAASGGRGGNGASMAANALQDYKAKARALRAREFELERSLRALSKFSAVSRMP